MKIYKFLIIAILTVVGIALLPAIASGWAQASLNQAVSQARSPHTIDIPAQSSEIQVVPATSFIQASDTDPATDDANNWLFDIDSGFLTSDSATDQVCLAAPVYLVPGRTIDSFTVFAADQATSADLTVFLDRTSFLGVWIEVARISTSGMTVGIQTLTDSTIATTDGASVVSADYHYHVSFCLPANSGNKIRVYGAQVEYSQTSGTVQRVYLPIMLKSELPSPTILLITNQTGGSLNYTVYNTPEGNITCTIPNGATNQLCGTFTAGSYNFKAVAQCGEKVGQRTYKPGNDALTPFRCIY